MSRRSIQPMHGFIATLVVAGVLSFAPLKWLGWVGDVAAIVRLPSVPFADAGTRVRVWLGGGEQRQGPPEGDPAFLQSELDRYRTLAQEWRRLAEDLARQNAQLQNAQLSGISVPFTMVNANIVGSNTQSDGKTYVLNVGTHRRDLQEGSVAVYDGAHLIGRVTNITRLQSDLVPVTDKSFKLFRAAVVPSVDNADLQRREIVHLENAGDGTFVGPAQAGAGIAVHDAVYLDDPSWPRTAQSLQLGVVRSVSPDDDNPVLVNLVVEPVYRAEHLGSVVIKVESQDGRSEGDG